MSPVKYLYSIDHFTLFYFLLHFTFRFLFFLSGFYSGASARAKGSLIGKRKWETYPVPIRAREFGYDDSLRPTVRTDSQGGTKQILHRWGWGIQVM